MLFLDEPTTGLDVQSALTIKELIRQLNAEGTTIFLTTHQIEEANQLCDRVAIIHRGQLAAVDTAERLKGAFQRVQSVEVAFDQDGLDSSPSPQALAALPEVAQQDLFNHAVLGSAVQSVALDLLALPLALVLFLIPTVWLHRWIRNLGY